MLLETLSHLPKTCDERLHLCLRVQGMERLGDNERKQVKHAARGFHSTDIYFTRDNVGTACARLDQLHRVCKNTNIPYLMYTDDDIEFPYGGIERQIDTLDRYPAIGSVSLRPKGIRRVQEVVDCEEDEMVKLRAFKEINDSLVEVYLVGSASFMFRRELYTQHMVAPDPTYYIGTWDWDLVMQVREAGYKVTIITDMEIRNKRGGEQEYRQKRRNQQYVKENRSVFISKWGFDPIRSRRFDKMKKGPIAIRDFVAETKSLSIDWDKMSPSDVVRVDSQNRVIGTDWKSRIAVN